MAVYQFNTNSVDCPVCKSSTQFRSTSANLKVCGICNTAMERLEGGLLAKILALQVFKSEAPFGILQIGTQGVFSKRSFEIIGCLHCDFDDYFSNRYTILWPDATTGLLVETLGFYSMYEKITSDFPSRLPTVKNVPVGTELIEILLGKQFTVFDKSRCNKVFLEGEVFSLDTDGAFSTIELGQLNGDRLELVELDKSFYELYQLTYVGLFELSLTNLHKIDNNKKALLCAKCGKRITILLPQQSQHCVCSNCNSWNEIIQGKELKSNKKNFADYNFDIPVGTKGTINGFEYQVTGAVVKNEVGSADVFWREYTLYDVLTGYAFLAEYNGHWSFLKEVKLNCPWPAHKEEIYFDNEHYVLFNNYSSKITSAAGEFFTSLNTADIIAREYVSPPEMYVAENAGGKDITWYKASHINNNTVFEGMGLIDKTMPTQHGVGPLQLMKFHINLALLFRMCGIIGLVFLGMQVFFEFNAKQEILYQNTFNIPDSLLSRGLTTLSFEIKQASSNLQFLMSAPVDNNWLQLSASLVNDRTGAEYNFEKGVEYYHGYTEGENWTEGERDAEVVLSSLPAGMYHLNIFPSTQSGLAEIQFSVTVVSDVPMWRNFFIILLMVALYPLVVWWRTQTFEKKRWNNSAYNPYQKDSE